MSQIVSRARLCASCIVCGAIANASAQMIPAPYPLAGCPIKVQDYVIGAATADLVKQCLGALRLEGRGEQGKFVYTYTIEGLGDISFQFDRSGVLLGAFVRESLI